MTSELLYYLDMWLILGGSISCFLLATEVGFRLGRRSRQGFDEQTGSEVNTLQGAMLGLLALLLGFTFAMATSRFDVRKQLVLDEANAIGTTFLRAQLLPEPQKKEVSDLLRQYVELRLQFYEAATNQNKFKAANAETERLHVQLWSHASDWGKQEPRSVPVGLFLQSLNEVIDLHAKRITAFENHVPEIILVLLYFVALGAVGLIGYGCGLGGRRNFLVTTLASVLIAAVILVIIDLDRPQRGLIKVSQKSMMDLRQSLQNYHP